MDNNLKVLYRSLILISWIGTVTIPFIAMSLHQLSHARIELAALWCFFVVGVLIANANYSFPKVWHWIKNRNTY